MLATIQRILGFGVRRPGYVQSQAVERWLEGAFQEAGLTEVRLEPVPVNCWEPKRTALTTANGAFEIPCFPIPYTAWTPAAGLEAPAAFVGSGTGQDFEGVDLRGRVAVLEARFAELAGAALKRGASFVRDEGGTIPDGSLHCANWLIRNFAAYYEAQKRGAVALIGLLADSPTDGCEFYVPYNGGLKDLPAVWVGREHAARVRDLARAGQRLRMTSLGKLGTVESHNVVGVAPGAGRDAEGKNESILVTSHHDAPFASAVEDASGLSVLLALAREFGATPRRLNRDLVFVAASGHFHGGVGNRLFVARHRSDLLQRTVAAFGIEHIAEEAEPDGRGGYRLTGLPEVRALFFDGSSRFAKLLEAAALHHKLDRMICADAYAFGPEPPCDSAPFFTEGIPSACHISGPLYLFDPQDTLDKVRAVDLPAVAGFFAEAIRGVDSMPAAVIAEGMKRPRGSPLPRRPSGSSRRRGGEVHLDTNTEVVPRLRRNAAFMRQQAPFESSCRINPAFRWRRRDARAAGLKGTASIDIPPFMVLNPRHDDLGCALPPVGRAGAHTPGADGAAHGLCRSHGDRAPLRVHGHGVVLRPFAR